MQSETGNAKMDIIMLAKCCKYVIYTQSHFSNKRQGKNRPSLTLAIFVILRPASIIVRLSFVQNQRVTVSVSAGLTPVSSYFETALLRVSQSHTPIRV